MHVLYITEIEEILHRSKAEGNVSPALGKQFPITPDVAICYFFCYKTCSEL